MGEQIVSMVASQAIGKVLSGGSGKSAAKAASAETARINAEAAAAKQEAEQKRKAKALQRPQTDVFLANQQQGNALGG